MPSPSSPSPKLLETTLATEFRPGTNQRWQVTGANWAFLLPRLDLGRILCIGHPTDATLAMLRRVGRSVTVEPTLHPARLAAAVDPRAAGLPTPGEGGYDLVAVVDPAAARDVLGREGALDRLASLLAPGGRTYLDLGVSPRGGAARRLRALARSGWAGEALWLTPLVGEIHTAVPLADAAVMADARREGWYSLSTAALKRTLAGQLRRRRGRRRDRMAGLERDIAGPDAADDTSRVPEALASATDARPVPAADASVTAPAVPAVAPAGGVRQARRIAGAIVARTVAWAEHGLTRRGWLPLRTGLLVGAAQGARGDAGPERATAGPPAYLTDLARAHGLDLGGWRWALSAKGEYASRKVLFFLYPPNGAAPEIIVKLTRDPAMNPRLENERRALEALWAAGVGDAATLPRVRFQGHHGGLAVVGESVVRGHPFRARTSWAADCRHANAAVDWLVAMSATTADAAAVSSAEAAAVLRDLYARFTGIYRLPAAERARLEAEIARVGAHPGPFPAVFQHGDPGTWNLVATADGRTAFLDWEAAEARGMPLWDVFYFLRSYAVGAARAGGEADVLRGVEAHFIRGSHLTAWLADGIRRARDAAGVPAELVPALFLTCWMHRALKEATRLPAAKVETGHYVSLLRLCLDRADDAGLRRVLGVEGAGHGAP